MLAQQSWSWPQYIVLLLLYYSYFLQSIFRQTISDYNFSCFFISDSTDAVSSASQWQISTRSYLIFKANQNYFISISLTGPDSFTFNCIMSVAYSPWAEFLGVCSLQSIFFIEQKGAQLMLDCSVKSKWVNKYVNSGHENWN